MALKEFKRIDSKDSVITKLQENIYAFLKQLNPITLNGLFLDKTIGVDPIDITIGTSTTLVSHGLGRAYQGWHLADLQGDARVWRDTTSTADETIYLPLRASTSVTVKLWVF